MLLMKEIKIVGTFCTGVVLVILSDGGYCGGNPCANHDGNCR